jgi:hypothetical protein
MRVLATMTDANSTEALNLLLSTVPVVLSTTWLIWYAKRRFDALEKKFDAFERHSETRDALGQVG